MAASNRAIPHHRAGVAAGRNGDQVRQLWEVSIQYEDLKKFSTMRNTVGPWRTTPVAENVVERWRNSNNLDEQMYAKSKPSSSGRTTIYDTTISTVLF